MCGFFLELSWFFDDPADVRNRRPKYWSSSFRISPFNEYSVLLSFRMIWSDCHAVKDLSRVFSSTTVQNHQFFCTLPNLLVDFQCCFICSHHNILHTTKNILGFYKCNISLCCMGHWLLTAGYTMPVFYTEGKNKTFPSSVTPTTVYIFLMKQT